MGVALLSKPSISRKKWELLKTVHLKKKSVIKGKPNYKPRKELPRAKLENLSLLALKLSWSRAYLLPLRGSQAPACAQLFQAGRWAKFPRYF